MIRPPPGSSLTDTLFPYPALFHSCRDKARSVPPYTGELGPTARQSNRSRMTEGRRSLPALPHARTRAPQRKGSRIMASDTLLAWMHGFIPRLLRLFGSNSIRLWTGFALRLRLGSVFPGHRLSFHTDRKSTRRNSSHTSA